MSLDGPFLWFLNRGTGVVLLILLTASVCLGVLATRARTGGVVPAFVRHDLHRNLSVLSLVMLLGHIATAVVDRYVDIRWWQALSPVGGSYQPLWLGMGALSFDVILLVVVTSAFRARLTINAWRSVHWLAYAAWAMAVAHAAGIGTDVTTPWGEWVGAGCVGAVGLAVAVRVVSPRRQPIGVAR